MDIDYAALYGVLPGEKDFSGAIKRHLEAKHFSNSSEYRELIDWIAQRWKAIQENIEEGVEKVAEDDTDYLEVEQWMDERQKSKDPEVRKALKDKINNFYYTHKECCEILHKNDNVHDETQQLILEYNRRMKDDVNYPNKDVVRIWYSCRSQELINRGAFAFSFLYPDFIGPIENLEKIYNKTNKNIQEKKL